MENPNSRLGSNGATELKVKELTLDAALEVVFEALGQIQETLAEINSALAETNEKIANLSLENDGFTTFDD